MSQSREENEALIAEFQAASPGTSVEGCLVRDVRHFSLFLIFEASAVNH